MHHGPFIILPLFTFFDDFRTLGVGVIPWVLVGVDGWVEEVHGINEGEGSRIKVGGGDEG